MINKLLLSLGVIGSFLILGVSRVPAQCGPDGTQPCPSANRKSPVKAKTNADSKSKSSSKTSDQIPVKSIAIRQPEKVSFPNASSSTRLFPLHGITLGVTTKAQLAQMGSTSDSQKCFVLENKWEACYNELELASKIFVAHDQKRDRMPDELKKIGFDMTLSYNEWTTLLTSLGYQVKIASKPEAVSNYWDAQLKGVKSPGEPEISLFFMTQRRGASYNYTTEKGTLDYMEIVLP